MALLFELASWIEGLVTKPLLFIKLSFQFGIQSIAIVIQTSIELLRAAIYLYLNIFFKLVIWAIAMLSLPLRAVTALQRERMLEVQLHEMRTELENVIGDRKELEEKLHVAIKEGRRMEMMLTELEDEHEEAIVRIQNLENEVQDLKEENQSLKEVQGKALWSHRSQGESVNCHNTKATGKLGTWSWKSDYGKSLNQEIIHEDAAEDKRHTLVNPARQFTPGGKISNDLEGTDFLVEWRELALSRTIFSAVMSLVVVMIVWQAEDPCMPLVVGLFTVVAMSLASVVRFFAAIGNKPASDAVTLLSLNWFILGTLTYPTLPRIVPLLPALDLRVQEWMSTSLGL